MKKGTRKQTQGKVAESRRLFMKKAVMGGAGATAAALGTGRIAAAAEEDAQPITIPGEFEAAERAPRPAVDFPMIGAQVFARACREEGIGALFCCPGNYLVVHAMAEAASRPTRAATRGRWPTRRTPSAARRARLRPLPAPRGRALPT